MVFTPWRADLRFATQSKRSAWLPLTLILAAAVSAQAQLPSPGTNVNVQDLRFAYQPGGTSPLQQTLQVASETPRPFTVTTSVTTPSGGANWLTVNGASSAAGSATPTGAFLTIGVVPGTLPVGAYTGNVRVQPEGQAPKDIAVTLRVSSAPQVALTVPVVSIQGQTGTQVLQQIPISSTGAAFPYFTSSVGQYQGASGWLSSTPNGTASAAGTAPTVANQATLTANLAGVPAGTHYAVVNFRPEGAGGFDVSLPVILNVTQVTTAAANPAQLNFAFQASNLGATTNNKVINISSSPSANLAYTATVTGDSRVSLSKSSTGPGASTVTGTTPENVYVLVNPVGIAAGTTVMLP